MDMTRGKDQRSTTKSEVGFCSEEICQVLSAPNWATHKRTYARAGAIPFKSQKALSPSGVQSRPR